MNNRRKLVTALGAGALGAGALAAPLASLAQQQGKVWRVGFLSPRATDIPGTQRLQAFRDGMREHGYLEGKNLQLQVRWAEGNPDRMAVFAAELVALKVDAIVTGGGDTTRAARMATKSIPIVMAQSSDPVADGIVASLARPDGNVTGLSTMSLELAGKRIQLLKELIPKLSRTLAVMWNSAQSGMRSRFNAANSAAPQLGLGVRSVEVRDMNELGSAFNTLSKEPPDAIMLIADPFTRSQSTRIIEFAAARRMPVIYESAEFVNEGGLMSYGPDLMTQYRRAAYYVDRILKGAKPGDLPIELPARFDFVINMKTAKALGIEIPNSILVQATKVIE